MESEGACKVKVKIMGQEYVLKGKDSSEYIEMLACFVAEKMEEISKRHPSYNPTKVAVLGALQIADEFNKLREDYDKIIEELQMLDKVHKIS